jgi:hypothetical protein
MAGNNRKTTNNKEDPKKLRDLAATISIQGTACLLKSRAGAGPKPAGKR